MNRFSQGKLGFGFVENGVSIVIRPDMRGYRVFSNHQPCNVLPFGGYAEDVSSAEQIVSGYKSLILAFAAPEKMIKPR